MQKKLYWVSRLLHVKLWMTWASFSYHATGHFRKPSCVCGSPHCSALQCEQYVFCLSVIHIRVCFPPSAMVMFPWGWNTVTVMIDSQTSSTDTPLFKERSTASRSPSIPCSFSLPFPLPLCFSVSLPSLSPRSRLSNLPRALLLTSNLKWS